MFKIVHIRPRRDFGSRTEVLELASYPLEVEMHLPLLDVQLVSVICNEEGFPVGLPNDFLAHIAMRSRSATGDTVRTYAEALVVWLDYISTHRFRLQDADEEMLAAFRNHLANLACPDGTRRYAPATVNNRIAVTEAFYSWAQKKGAIKTALGAFLTQRENESATAFWQGAGRRRKRGDSLRMGEIRRMPRVLSSEEISSLFLVVRKQFALMFRWALATGMRRFEVCWLRKSSLPTASSIAAKGMALVPVEVVRKGGKTITVHAPAALVEETLWYCLIDRKKDTSSEYSDYVFLSRHGRPYARSSISEEFRRCADVIGTDATLHHLRHTFATLVLGILESTGRSDQPVNSIKAVQILLGHANITTTEVYLRALNVSSDSVRNALDFLYGETL